jgi:hypothetical protein
MPKKRDILIIETRYLTPSVEIKLTKLPGVYEKPLGNIEGFSDF